MPFFLPRRPGLSISPAHPVKTASHGEVCGSHPWREPGTGYSALYLKEFKMAEVFEINAEKRERDGKGPCLLYTSDAADE